MQSTREDKLQIKMLDDSDEVVANGRTFLAFDMDDSFLLDRSPNLSGAEDKDEFVVVSKNQVINEENFKNKYEDALKRFHDKNISIDDKLIILHQLHEDFENYWENSRRYEVESSKTKARFHPKFTAMEGVFSTIAEDKIIHPYLRGNACLFLINLAISFLPMKTGTPLDEPHMVKIIYYNELILFNSTFHAKQRVDAAVWLACRYLNRLPNDAGMDHVYGQKAIEYVEVILRDELIPPALKDTPALIIAHAYEKRIENNSDENSKQSKNYQQYLNKSLDEEVELKEDLEGNIIVHPESVNLALLGFWKTNPVALENIKRQLMVYEPGLCWNPAVKYLLALVGKDDLAAQSALTEIIEWHFQAILENIPKFVTLFKEQNQKSLTDEAIISNENLRHAIQAYTYGNGFVPLPPTYEELRCEHLRFIYYLISENIPAAKEAFEKFYQKLNAAFKESNIAYKFEDYTRPVFESVESLNSRNL